MKLTKKIVLRSFMENVLPCVINQYGKNDLPAKREAWNNYTDGLCKNGQITIKQYENWNNPF